MTSISQAAVAASVLVGLVSIPAVSQTAPPSSSMETSIPNVSTQNTGREVVKQVSPDGFTARISTAFEEFATTASHEKANASLETPTADLQMEKTSTGARWKLSTATGALTVKRTHDSVTEITETPEGTLKVRRENGATTRTFQGSDREAVETSRDALHQRLEEKKAQLDDRREQLEPEKEISIVMNSSYADGFGNQTEQRTEIVNEDDRSYDLSGWRVIDGDGDVYEIEDAQLEPGETLRVYYNSEDELDYEGENAVYDAHAWGDTGDTAILKDSEGDKVDSSSF